MALEQVSVVRGTVRRTWPARRTPSSFVAFYLFAFAVGMLLLWRRGIDLNYDLLNYHLASAYLLLHPGLWEDVHPSGLQIYFSPFVNVPTYFGLTHLGPIAWRIVLTGWQSLFWPILLTSFQRVLVDERVPLALRRPGATTGLLVALAGLGPLLFSVLGTSFADLTLGVPIAAVLAVTLRGRFAPDWRRGLASGAVCGLVVALKPTTLVQVAPLAIATYATMLVVAGATRRFAHEVLAFAVGAVALGGPVCLLWMAKVAAETGNPFFPYLNGLFHSPLAPDGNWSDRTFIPASPGAWLLRPARLALGTPHLIGEVAVRDIRWAALFYLVGPVGAALGLAVIVRGGRAAVAAHAGTFCLALFASIGLPFWAVLFSIGRYIPVLEMVSGFLLLRALLAVGRWGVGLATLLALANVVTFHPPDWGSRREPFRAPGRYAARPAFDHALVFLARPPLGWALPYLGPGSRAVLPMAYAADGDGGFATRVRSLIARRWPDGVWLLSAETDTSTATGYLASYGLRVTRACRPVETWLVPLRACRVDPARPPGAA